MEQPATTRNLHDANRARLHRLRQPRPRACAELGGDGLLVASEQGDYVRHSTLTSYRSAFVGAHSLPHRTVDGADHALSSEESQNAYSAILTAWISEMVIGARLDRHPITRLDTPEPRQPDSEGHHQRPAPGYAGFDRPRS